MTIGAGIAAAWFVIFTVTFLFGLAPNSSDVVAGVMMSATFFGAVALVPSLIDEKHKNLRSGLFRCLGAAMMAVPLFAGLVMYLLSNLKIIGHQ